MPAKKKTTKPRTSRTKANKKISAPRWVIVVVLLIVVGTGAFLIYKSFAFPGTHDPFSGTLYTKVNVHCKQGLCAREPFTGSELHVVFIRNVNTADFGTNDLCGLTRPPYRYREAKFVNNPDVIGIGDQTTGKFTPPSGKRHTPSESNIRSDVCLGVPPGTI